VDGIHAPELTGRSGLALPRLGLGTWRMGEDPARRRDEVAALRLGLDLGVRLIDTAEMYADGEAERIVAEAVRDRRDDVVLVSKVLPQNASRRGTVSAAEHSLARLGTDRIDLYLLHWSGDHPLEETYAAFLQLVDEGKILHYGVSNLDVEELECSEALPGGAAVAANQVLYNLLRRGVEHRLLPWCRHRRVTVMAYSPLEQGRLPGREALRSIARDHGCTEAQVALAWVLAQPGVMTIPKAGRPEHVREAVGALAIGLTGEDLVRLDHDYPRPAAHVSLEFL
jgi:diketogulonate reductase-like aldo/keto reductase